jgi:putative ABC transport system permease protein
MSLLHIAWRNFRFRMLSSFLTTFSLALGVALVVLVLAIYGIITDAFRSNSAVSYNLVVGPPGDRLPEEAAHRRAAGAPKRRTVDCVRIV